MSVGRDGSGDEDALAGHVRTACACVGSDVTLTEKLRVEALWRPVARHVLVMPKLTSGGYNRFMCVEYGLCRAGDALGCVFHASGGRCERLLHGYEKHGELLDW